LHSELFFIIWTDNYFLGCDFLESLVMVCSIVLQLLLVINLKVKTMAKAISPVRLQDDLMQAAKLTGDRFHRSTAEQIEYWADIGRKVSKVLDPDTLLSISTGLTQVKVEPIYGKPIDPDDVFSLLEAQRQQGTLTQAVTSSPIKYQPSLIHPGYLERIDQNSNVSVGQFQNGEFVTVDGLRS